MICEISSLLFLFLPISLYFCGLKQSGATENACQSPKEPLEVEKKEVDIRLSLEVIFDLKRLSTCV